jgi:demethylmenaquinone methyltransferase/2-methoxy-6-polyprenyl-1,4-benzoquinol methylase
MDAYYQARAGEYEDIYARPERQSDLARLKQWLIRETRDKVILELACGTGYWTALAAAGARFVLATDRNSAPLGIARCKPLGGDVAFCVADAYALPVRAGHFDCGMAHFWWSHVPRGRIGAFLSRFASHLAPRATLLLSDNAFVGGSSTPLSRRDVDGNTYQIRTLRTGDRHEILKNFPSTSEIRAALAPVCAEVDVLQLGYYWAACGLVA